MTCPNCEAAMDPWDKCQECGHKDVDDCTCDFCEAIREADDPPEGTLEY